MLKRIGKRLINNIGLKILAILFGAMMWIVVVNIDDPVITLTYTTSVSFANQDYITSQNKIFDALDGSNTISFRVSASRSLHDQLSNADFTATADMEKIEYNEETGIYRVPIVVSQAKYSSSKVTLPTGLYKEVALEDMGRVQKPIVAETSGTVADGCALGEVSIVGANIVKIQGPASIVGQIDRVVASVNVGGMATDVTDTVIPVLYDADGDTIDTTRLTLSVDKVSINAQILNTKDISLEFLTSGTVADGYMVTNISYEPETVRIKGEASVLNPVNKVSIPGDVLVLTDVTDTIETTVDITSYLPTGTSLVVTSDAKVEVTVEVEPIKTKTFDVPVGNLTIENLAEGYVLEYDEDAIVIELVGAESVIDKLKAEDIEGTINVSGLRAGNHRVEVEFDFDELGCEVEDTILILVTLAQEDTE